MHILRQVIHRLFEAAGDDGAAGGETGGDKGPTAEQLAATERQAREMGWAPKEQWRGNPEGWLSADEFVRRGEQVMPILQANLRKRDTQVTTLQQQIADKDRRLAAAEEAIGVLTNISTEQGRTNAKEKRRELLRQQAEARREGDTELEITLGEQIADVTLQINRPAEEPAVKPATKGATKQPPTADPATNPTADPAYQAFLAENSWFGTDRRKTAMATAIGEELRNDPANANLLGKPFFDKVAAEVNKFFAPARGPSKVETGNGGGGARTVEVDNASGKSYADLPADAKDACARSAKLVVGEGRAFKDMAAWQKHYVSVYFNS